MNFILWKIIVSSFLYWCLRDHQLQSMQRDQISLIFYKWFEVNVVWSLHFSALLVWLCPSRLLRRAAARLLPARMMNPSCLYFYLSLLSNFDEVRPFFVSKTNSEFELILTSIYNPPRARAESDTLLVAEEERVSSDHNFIHPHSSAIFNSSNWFLWLSLRSDAKYFRVWIMNRIEIKVRSLVSQTRLETWQGLKQYFSPGPYPAKL